MAMAFAALMRLVRPALAEPDRGLVERFAVAGDQQAFAALVERHGPMVLGVCRRVLRDEHRADDAFQATFLVLARKAGRLHIDGSLSSWLFGVARRVSLAARRSEQRQQRLRFRARSNDEASAKPQASTGDWDNLLQLLDEELARLPDKLRAPLLACYLDGRTQDEAAHELGWSLSSVRRRLEQGRELLKVRLTARGAALSAGLFAGALAPTARAMVSENLRQTALAIAPRGAIVPQLIAQLAQEGMGMSAITKWTIALTIACGFALTLSLAATAQKPAKENPAPAKPPAAEVKRDRFNDPLPPRAIARMGTVGFRHRGAIGHPGHGPEGSLSYDDAGKLLISSGFGSTSIWDVESGRERASLGGQNWAANENAYVAQPLTGVKELIIQAHSFLGRDTGVVVREYVWNIAESREVRKINLVGHDESKQWRRPAVFSPVGNAMAAVQENGDIWLWDGSGKPTHVLAGPMAKPLWVIDVMSAFTRDGKALVSCDGSHQIKTWDVATGKLLQSFGGQLARPEAFALSPDGKHAATIALKSVEGAALVGAAVPDSVRVWDVTSGKLALEIPWGDESQMRHRLFLTFSPDNRSLIAVNEATPGDLRVRRWSTSDGKLIREWSVGGPLIQTSAIAIDPAGKSLAIGTILGLIRVFELETGKERTPTDIHLASVSSLAFCRDNGELRSAGYDFTVRTWDIATGRPLGVWRSDGAACQLTPDGDFLLNAVQPGKTDTLNIKVREGKTGKLRTEINGVKSYAIGHDGKTIWILETETGNLKQIVLDSGASRRSFKAEPGRVIAVTDNGRLVVIADDKRILGWDTSTGKKRFEWSMIEQKMLREISNELRDRMHVAAVSSDGRLIAMSVLRDLRGPSQDEMNNVFMCELATGKVLWHKKSLDESFGCVAFRPDGKVLAVGGRKLSLYDSMSGKQLAELGDHRNLVNEVTFSADGKRLASGGVDGTAMVWDVADISP